MVREGNWGGCKFLSSLCCSLLINQGSNSEQQFYSDVSGSGNNTEITAFKKKEMPLIIFSKVTLKVFE